MTHPLSRRRRLVAGDDLAVVAGQLGRRPHPMSRVVRRCPFGYPAVVETLPADAAGRPFPTLFYATCPTLVVAVGKVESAGGVRHFERRLRDDPALARSVVAATRQTRRRRRDLVAAFGLELVDGGASLHTGIGGVADPRALKCLHAHAAHALAHPGYLIGEAVLAEADDLWCTDSRCAAWAHGEAAPSARKPVPKRRAGSA
jgi:hypothetical protein